MSRAVETALWCEVISQAIRDATVCGGIPAHARDATRAHARSWFRATNRDFIDVCNLAGLDPEAISERSLMAIARYDRAIAKENSAECVA